MSIRRERRWHRAERWRVRPVARTRSVIDRIGYAAITRFVRQEITPGGGRHLPHGHSIQSSHRRECLRLDDDITSAIVKTKKPLTTGGCCPERQTLYRSSSRPPPALPPHKPSLP